MTIAEFQHLWDSGVYTGTRRVILVDGEAVEMPRPDPPHDIALNATYEFLRAAGFAGHYIRNQQGFVAGTDTCLDPDLAIVRGTARDYLGGWPATATMTVEVANTAGSLTRYCRMVAHIYAAAGVPEYWLLDVVGRQLLVFRDPVADPSAERAHRYATQLTLAETDRVSPQAAPAASVVVADLLP